MTDTSYTCTNCGGRHEMLQPCPKEILVSVFGENEPETYSDKYDAIMNEAREAYVFQKSVGNPYAFHQAFEYAQRRVNRLNQEQNNP